ncbi:kinesin-associated protein-domain-containing protein [Scenedesmus sp. NREL 46B-D3]|nr:kinesin-associated protein-domain-containing protein [Scenedesmus sp. NREL 46B-D3]
MADLGDGVLWRWAVVVVASPPSTIRPGALELHPAELALVVHYEVQEVLQQPDGTQEVANSSQATKKVTVKSLNERTDLPALAAEVVDKCKLIHPSKTGLVQGLLQQLQQRQRQRQAAPAPAEDQPPQPAQPQPPGSCTGSQPAAQAAAAAHGRPGSASSNSSSSSSSQPVSSSSPVARPGSASAQRGSSSSSSAAQQQGQGPGPHGAAARGSATRIGRQQRAVGGLQGEAAQGQQQQQQQQQRTLVQASEIFAGLASSSSSSSSPAFLEELDSYIEGLYDEELAKRAAAAGMICQLFRNTAHLEVGMLLLRPLQLRASPRGLRARLLPPSPPAGTSNPHAGAAARFCLLPPLLSRDSLLPSLSRLLREDGLKSLELATAVAGCFLACSSLAQLHKLLLENQLHKLLLENQVWQACNGRSISSSSSSSGSRTRCGGLAEDAAAAAAAPVVPSLQERTLGTLLMDLASLELLPLQKLHMVGTLLMDLASLELLQRAPAREAQEGPGSSAGTISARAAAAAAGGGPAMKDRERRLASLVVRQDKFLYLAVATLQNLAEEQAVQRKMRRKDIVALLAALLQRPHAELLLLAVGFLRRLCVFAEHKERLAGTSGEHKERLAGIPGVLPQLVSLLAPGCGEALQTAALRLLHNLSFDRGLRQQMVAAGLVPQAVALLDSRAAAPVAAGLLYQLSAEQAARPLFALCPGALARLHDSLLRAMAGGSPAGQPAGKPPAGQPSPQQQGGCEGFAGVLAAAGGAGDLRSVPELVALAVNLAHSRRTAELVALAVNLAHSRRTAEATGVCGLLLLLRAVVLVGERLERLLARSLAASSYPLAHGKRLERLLWFCEGERLERLLARSLAASDELAWKLLRNLAGSGAGAVAGRLLVHARGMVALLQSPTTGPELFVEVLGTLAAACDALSSSSQDGGSSSGGSLGQLLPVDELLRLLQACFVPGALEDDALLEAVVLLGALAGRPELDEPLASCGLLARLVELMPAKKADDEFVLQACWAFSRCLTTPAATAALLSLPQVVPYLVTCCKTAARP